MLMVGYSLMSPDRGCAVCAKTELTVTETERMVTHPRIEGGTSRPSCQGIAPNPEGNNSAEINSGKYLRDCDT